MWEITWALSAYCVLAFWDMGSVWSCFLKWKFLFKGNIQWDKIRSKSCNSLLDNTPNFLVGCVIQKRWSPLSHLLCTIFPFLSHYERVKGGFFSFCEITLLYILEPEPEKNLTHNCGQVGRFISSYLFLIILKILE